MGEAIREAILYDHTVEIRELPEIRFEYKLAKARRFDRGQHGRNPLERGLRPHYANEKVFQERALRKRKFWNFSWICKAKGAS